MLFYSNLDEYIQEQRDKLDHLPQANIPEKGLILKVLKQSDNERDLINQVKYSKNQDVEFLEIDYLGIIGERHRRAFRHSTGREKSLYPKGTTINENRQIVAVSLYDCKILSEKMNLNITPEILGANIVIEREDRQDFSLSALPVNSYILIGNPDSAELPKPPNATLINYTRQQGCVITGNAIAKEYCSKNPSKWPSISKRFIDCSKDNRGILCSVEFPVNDPAIIKKGQSVFFLFPKGVTP